jgi:cytochrome P450
MEPGQRVVLLLAAANRDPRAYDDPDDFDPWRQGPAVLSLGGGAHACLGGGIARMETRIALAQMLTLPSPVLSGEAPPRWREGHNLRRLESLPVRLG